MMCHGIRLNNAKRWGLWFYLCFAASFSCASFAEENAESVGSREIASESKNGSQSEYDFSWLDPDKKIYVLQNRRYIKAERLMFSVMGTLGLSNPYRSVKGFDLRGSYFFSESFGTEVFYQGLSNSDNNTYESLLQSANTLPKIREITGNFGVLAMWVPWYAKINFFNQILYFDWYLTAGLGKIQTDLDVRTTKTQPRDLVSESFTSFMIGTGHQYHLSDTWTVRIDFLGSYYQAPLLGNTGEDTTFSNYTISLGIGARL